MFFKWFKNGVYLTFVLVIRKIKQVVQIKAPKVAYPLNGGTKSAIIVVKNKNKIAVITMYLFDCISIITLSQCWYTAPIKKQYVVM